MKKPSSTSFYPSAAVVLLMLIGGCFSLISNSVAQQNSMQETAPASAPPETLASTSWQLVQIMSMDDQVFTPSEPSHYALYFDEDERVRVRVDCNRGQGTWSTNGPSQLEFGPLATTRMLCPPGSLHDRFLNDLKYVRSYIFKDGHLFLATMADGAILEFEPLTSE